MNAPICAYCKNLTGLNTCTAFPVSIPPEIKENLHDHRLEYPGDNGILFNPAGHNGDLGENYANSIFGELKKEGE